MDTEQLTLAWQSVVVAADYPDEALLGPAELVQAARRRSCRPRRGARSALPAAPGHDPLADLQATYVETFDKRRRLQPLPDLLRARRHPQAGDGAAALQADLPARRGSSSTTAELPDHLCVVLEYAATVDQRLGRGLLLDHRAGLELLRLSLRDRARGGPARSTVCATLPPLRGEERDAVRKLAADGPPAEEVGLTPFGTRSSTRRWPRSPNPADARHEGSRRMNTFLWVVVPYVCLSVFVLGHLWRYRYDKFGWTTRSSQLYENRLLRIGSPLFHFGMLGVVFGHVIGLADPGGVDRGRRDLAGDVPLGGGLGGVSPACGRGRHGHPDLPPAHRRPGVLGDDADGQGHVPFLAAVVVLGHVEHDRGSIHPRRRVRLPRGSVGLVPGSFLASTCSPS